MQTGDTEHVVDNRWELRETQPSPLHHLRDVHSPQEQFIIYHWFVSPTAQLLLPSSFPIPHPTPSTSSLLQLCDYLEGGGCNSVLILESKQSTHFSPALFVFGEKAEHNYRSKSVRILTDAGVGLQRAELCKISKCSHFNAAGSDCGNPTGH